MKVKKKKTKPKPQTVWYDPKAKTVTFTLARWEKEKREYQEIATKETAKLYLLALAQRGWNDDELCNLFEEIIRYAQYLDDDVVRMKDVERIIEKYTGMMVQEV